MNIISKRTRNAVYDTHVHLLVSLPPRLAVATLINSLKGVSSRYLRRDYGEELNKTLWGNHLWSRSYYVGTAGGASLDSLKSYIQSQDRPRL